MGKEPLEYRWEKTHGNKANAYLQAGSSAPTAPTLPSLSCKALIASQPTTQGPLYILRVRVTVTSTVTEIDGLHLIGQATEDALETFPGLSGRGPDGLALPIDSHRRPKHPGSVWFRTTEGSLLHLMTVLLQGKAALPEEHRHSQIPDGQAAIRQLLSSCTLLFLERSRLTEKMEEFCVGEGVLPF